MISHLPPPIDRPQSVNNSDGGSGSYTALMCIVLFLNWVLCGQSFQYVRVYNFTNMHAMSHRSDFFASSSRVNIWELAFCVSETFLSAVSQFWLPSLLIPAAMSDSTSINTSLQEVIISCKNKHIFIRDLSDLTLRIIFNPWWASINVGSRRVIEWNNSRHTSSWRFCLHFEMDETGSPGIICIVSHQVFRHPSEHGTSSMGKHLLAEAHIAKLHELTESEVTELTSSMADETALAILKRQGSRGITIVCSRSKFIFYFPFNPYWLNQQI